MALEVRDFHQKKISTWLNSARYTLEVDFNDYAGELNGDIAKAASGRPAAVASA
jgi:dimethylaniline monooxygenase (N-oxide forming)